MKLLVSSRVEVSDLVNLLSNSNPLVISITDPKSDIVKFNLRESNILRLQFHDLEKDYPGNEPAIILFKKETAKQIKDFLFDSLCLGGSSIAAIRQTVRQTILVVHCEAGISRSAGVAAAISMHFNKDCSEFFENGKYIPNRLVYKTLLDELNGQDNNVPVVKLRICDDYFGKFPED